MTNEEKKGERTYGTYEIFDGNRLIGRQERAGFYELSVLYINFHDVGNYKIVKVD